MQTYNYVLYYQLNFTFQYPDSKVHGANMGPTWIQSAQAGPHVGPMNLAIRDIHVQTIYKVNHNATYAQRRASWVV